MKSLYTFFTNMELTMPSYRCRNSWERNQANLFALSDTWWACRWHNVSAVRNSLKHIMTTLAEFSIPPYHSFIEASGVSQCEKTRILRVLDCALSWPPHHLCCISGPPENRYNGCSSFQCSKGQHLGVKWGTIGRGYGRRYSLSVSLVAFL